MSFVATQYTLINCMEQKIYTKPGVFIGLSTDKAFKGKSVHFRIDDKIQLEVDLDHPMPSELTEGGFEPGNEQQLFFKKKLIVEYPKEVEGHIEVFVTKNRPTTS